MKTGTGQDRITVMMATGDTSLADHYCGILEKGYHVVVCNTLDETLEQLTALHPALLILDPQVTDKDPNKSIADILASHPGLRIIVIENETDSETDQRTLFKTGVHGFCRRDIADILLCKAVHLVLEGEYWIQRKLITQVISELAKDAGTIVSRPDGPDDSLISTLTPRELQVARMVHMGGNNKMIARELDISERTVKAHLSAIFRKLDIENRLHLALYFSTKA